MAAKALRFSGLEARGRALLGVFAGLSLGLSQAPFDFPYLMVLAVPLLVRLLDGVPSARAAGWLGWWAGTAYFALVLSWIVEPFLVDIARHGWMAPFALVLMAGGLALFWALAFWLAARVAAGWVRMLVLVVCWAAAEWLRGHIFTGFPWGLLAYGVAETPLMQGAAYLGPYGLGMLLVLVLALPARGVVPGIAALAILGAGWWAGAARVGPVAETGSVVRMVQPNAAQHLKWQPEMLQVFFERLMESTRAPGAPDVVIWPETSVPFLYGDRPDLLAEMSAAANAPLIYGLRRIGESGSWHNTLAVAEAGRDVAFADKDHLVPFGEYMPFGDFFAGLGVFGLAAEDVAGFSSGAPLAPMDVAGLPIFLPLICYEAVFPEEVQGAVGDATWMVHITNDAWFGQWTGPYQHLAQARFRAVEHGMPVARAANTGISGMIDPYGRVTASIPLGQDGFVDAALPEALPQTPYGRLGEAIFAGLLGALALAAFAAGRMGRA